MIKLKFQSNIHIVIENLLRLFNIKFLILYSTKMLKEYLLKLNNKKILLIVYFFFPFKNKEIKNI